MIVVSVFHEFVGLLSAFAFLLLFLCSTNCETTNRYEKFSGNKSRLKLIVISDRNMSGFSFYPTEDDNVSNNRTRLSSARYPEPGCSCVPKLKQCDYECCYCQLGCQLPQSSIDGEDWLGEYFKSGCHSSRDGLTIRERRELASKSLEYLCERPDYIMNARMPFYQFFCLKFDNSYASSHYDVRPRSVNLLRLPLYQKARGRGRKMRKQLFWPITSQTFYHDNCNTSRRKEDEFAGSSNSVTQVLDEPKLLQLRVSQLFQLQPPPPIRFPSKGQEKHCIRNRIDGDEILRGVTGSVMKGNRGKGPDGILDAIPKLWTRKISYSTGFDLTVKQGRTSGAGAASCQQFRSLLGAAGRPWIQRFLDFAHGNKSDPSTQISIKALEPINLSQSERLLFGAQNESYPGYCHNLIAGLEVTCYYRNDVLIQMTYQIMTRDGEAGSSVPFFIQVKPVSTRRALRSKLSRFWSEFYDYKCPDQFCWRDVLDFSHLYGDSFSILFVFVSAPVLALSLFDTINYDNI